MSIDKNFCMSSFLAFRYIEDPDKNFYQGMTHKNFEPVPPTEKIYVHTAQEIDEAISKQFELIKENKCGILLSGGMDSAILASYMSGSDAYTFRFLNGKYQEEELSRAEYYASYYNLNLHYVDIDWNTVEKYLDILMKAKGAPVHSIEPQILQGALQAKADGITMMIIGNGSDYVFGGMNQLLAKDWDFDDFVKRYTFLEPRKVLQDPVDMTYLFERYRKGDKIDFLQFMNDISTIESFSSYMNAFAVADLPYCDLYAKMALAAPLDLHRVRHGESKYLIRELFSIKYPEISVPEKIPMPRPVDVYFSNWTGPTRNEFKKDLDMSSFSGNQKWQLYALERFLALFES